jgi:hypothetical protein
MLGHSRSPGPASSTHDLPRGNARRAPNRQHQKVLVGDRICFEACLAKDRRVFCWKIFVDFKLQALISSGKSTVPSRVNSAAYANAASISGSVSAGVAPQYLFARYTCRNVIHYDGHKDTCSADARSAVADGRVYADSLAPILHTFILTRFSPQRHRRRHSSLYIF